MSQADDPRGPIIGQGRGLYNEEATAIQEMIQDAQRSARKLTIPAADLDANATTRLSPAAATVVRQSRIRELLQFFNRDFLYGQGRFDEYQHGLILKWGDGYSRKHIWLTVEGENLVFQTSHERACAMPNCRDGYHVYTPEQWRDLNTLNAELAEQFKRPIHEGSDD